MLLKKIATTLKCPKLLISISPYQPVHKDSLTEIFKSNQPLYFLDHELPELYRFLDDEALTQYYDVLLINGRVIASGGIVENENGSVSMCWGMVHSDFHKKGYGKFLLEHRLQKCFDLFPSKPIILRTAQHTWKFFEKYNFKLIFTEKDYWGKGMDLYHMERE